MLNLEYPNIGIIGAMDCEVNSIVDLLEDCLVRDFAGLRIYDGVYNDSIVSVVKCGIGKVNAAMCAQMLIDRRDCEVLINTGIAGAISEDLKVGDVVVSVDAVEHDFNATGVGYPQGEIPDQATSIYTADKNLVDMIKNCDFSSKIDGKVMFGLIASGDIFVSKEKTKQFIHENFNAMCCEMEGAAIAHVAHKNNIPFVIIRSISDSASDDAGEVYANFEQHAANISKTFTLALLENLCKS